MTLERKSLGQFGEDLAVSFLRKKGYKLLETNFRTRYGEIDIICKKRNKIIFVEVKTRSSNKFGTPEESINKKKQQKLTLMAHQYLQAKKLYHLEFGIDGVFIDKRGDDYAIRHIENIIII